MNSDAFHFMFYSTFGSDACKLKIWLILLQIFDMIFKKFKKNAYLSEYDFIW